MNDIKTLIARKIVNGKDLSIQDIRVILSILRGQDNDGLLSQIHSGEIIPFNISNVYKYIAKQEPKRPRRNATETRNMVIAFDYINFKKTMKRKDVLLKLESESIVRYGTHLNAERIIDCITQGKKSLKLVFDLHSNFEEDINQTIVEYLNCNPNIAKEKLTLFEFLTESY